MKRWVTEELKKYVSDLATSESDRYQTHTYADYFRSPKDGDMSNKLNRNSEAYLSMPESNTDSLKLMNWHSESEYSMHTGSAESAIDALKKFRCVGNFNLLFPMHLF